MLCQLVIPSVFFNNVFRQLIMNTDFEKVIEHMNNIEDDYRGYIQKIMILQIIQNSFLWNVIGGRKIVNSDMFFRGTNMRTNIQNDSSEFEGLLQKMLPKETFIIPEICYINMNDEKKYALCLHT